jgi:hypothetical protein
VRTPPEELVNSASSSNLSIQLQRSRANQPDPTFPQSPGIILKRTTQSFDLTARFVLSMNCEHHTSNSLTDNELIPTACSPKTTREQRANNSNHPMESIGSPDLNKQLFTGFSPDILAL